MNPLRDVIQGLKLQSRRREEGEYLSIKRRIRRRRRMKSIIEEDVLITVLSLRNTFSGE